MKHLLVPIMILFCLSLGAQDTTRVQTFTFDDISKRRGWFEFPSDGDSYRKIMMNYTLKCDAQTQQDNFACGEWDYTTYTDLFTYDGLGTQYYQAGNQVLDSIPYLSTPIFDYYQSEQVSASYAIDLNQIQTNWGTDVLDSDETLHSDRVNHRSQYLYTDTELDMTAQQITKMAFNVVSSDTETQWLTIRLAHTDLTSLTDGMVIDEGLELVYELHTSFASGWQTLEFPYPFDYDGTSNLLVDISMRTETPMGMPTVLRASDDVADRGLVSPARDRCLDFAGDQYVEIPAGAFADVDQEITLSFWAYGDPATMPFNTWGLEGVDAENRRVVNVHLPWSNGRVYWDAGNEMSANYDRIDIAVDAADYAGRWTHWAFVKDAEAGTMAIYMDGEQIHSGTGMNRSMAGVTRFKLGGRADQQFTGNYDGRYDQFQVWNTALDQSEIEAYMAKTVDAGHPQYASLQAAYAFDEMDGAIALDYSPHERHAQLMGLPTRETRDATTMNMDMELSAKRPDVQFYQSANQPSLSTSIVTEAVAHPLHSVIESIPSIDVNFSGATYTYVDTTYVYFPGESVTYAPNGDIVSSEEVAATDTYYNSFKQIRHQLQNYVTPYGIGLSLGPNGFRWQYEVTDYRLLFDGLVEIAAGNQQELIDLEFVMIEGTPPRDPMAFETIWLGDYAHSAIADDEVMPAVDRTLMTEASEFVLRTRTTGHWFGGDYNCAEFCPKDFNIEIDGVQQFEWLNWKECADNPVIDQGGTWIFDRAGWCPGTFADSYDHDITPFVTAGGTHSINQGMEPYPSDGGEGNYRHTLQLFQYGPKNFQYDVEVEEIVSPNSWEFHNRYNPICTDPEIIVRNLGAETVTEMAITYWIDGGASEVYNWTGSLAFGERENVILPMSSQSFWNGSDEHVFYASVSAPNGQADEHANNDLMSAAFEQPVVVVQDFYVLLRANNAPNETSYTITNSAGEVVFEKDDFTAGQIHRDTLYLPNDCYVLRLEDSDDDGLEFFANNDGTGLFILKNVSGSNIKSFNTAFGKFIEYHFVLDKTVGLIESDDADFVKVSPNPSEGVFNLSIDGYVGSDVRIEVRDAIGATVYSLQELGQGNALRHEIDLSDMSEGIYFARIFIDGRQIVRRLIKH